MHIAIIGGGFCGVSCARQLTKLLPEAQISIFTQDSYFEYHGDLYKVLSGASPHLTRISYRQLVDLPNISLVHDPVVQINPDTKSITTTTSTYQYDVTTIAIGAQAVYYDIPGVQEHAYTCRSTEDAVRLHTLVTQELHQADDLEIVIAGAGPAGIEFAGHLAALCLQLKHPYSIILVDAAPQFLPMLNVSEREPILHRLQELNIQLQLDTHIQKYQSGVAESDKGSLYADLLLWCAGQKANHLATIGTELSTTPKGTYAVNEFLQTSNPSIYAGGDCSSAKDSGLAWSAVSHGNYIAQHITATVRHQSIQPYTPPIYPFVLPIGPHWAIVKQNNHLLIGFAGNVQAKQLKAQLWGELLQ